MIQQKSARQIILSPHLGKEGLIPKKMKNGAAALKTSRQ
jgi:hypothetical protein